MPQTYLHEERMREVSRNHGFIMGASGAAIAFAMHQTADREPSLSLLVALVAVVIWAFSFFSGLMNSHAKQAAMAFNVKLNEELDNGVDADADLITMFRKEFTKYNTKARRWYSSQLYALLLGSLVFVSSQAMYVYKVEDNVNRNNEAIESCLK